jgi:hypothetical protein|tara:strand:- start:4026 stop:4319 length:294 start_codon:yes stop_codon:yes gene_type:complete
MRVRISYSVDLDDVPNECARMLNDTLNKLNKVHEDIESLVHQLDNNSTVDWQVQHKLNRCRKSLAKIDMILEDNSMILEGYHSSKNPKEEEDVTSEG